MTIGGSLALIAVGAILRYAVTAHVNGFNLQTAGLVLMIVGIVGLLFSLLYTFVWASSRRRGEYVDPDAPTQRPPTYYR
jgi:heme/copper-type cytochrome/quinol oxidase subunit 2